MGAGGAGMVTAQQPSCRVGRPWRLDALGSLGVVAGVAPELTRRSDPGRDQAHAPSPHPTPGHPLVGRITGHPRSAHWLPMSDSLPTGVAHPSLSETTLSFLPGVLLPGTRASHPGRHPSVTSCSFVRRENKAVSETGEGVK